MDTSDRAREAQTRIHDRAWRVSHPRPAPLCAQLRSPPWSSRDGSSLVSWDRRRTVRLGSQVCVHGRLLGRESNSGCCCWRHGIGRAASASPRGLLGREISVMPACDSVRSRAGRSSNSSASASSRSSRGGVLGSSSGYGTNRAVSVLARLSVVVQRAWREEHAPSQPRNRDRLSGLAASVTVVLGS